MTTDRDLDEVLAELGREHRGISAPETVERLLCTAACSRKSSIDAPGMRFKWAWAVVAILLSACATAGIIWEMREMHSPQNQQGRSVPMPARSPGPARPSTPLEGRQSGETNSAPMREVGMARVSRRSSPPRQTSVSSLDEFVALPVSEGLPLAAELSVVRVKLRGSDLQQYGLETPADAFAQTMLAEFVVGEDGLPRAIRIVR